MKELPYKLTDVTNTSGVRKYPVHPAIFNYYTRKITREKMLKMLNEDVQPNNK